MPISVNIYVLNIFLKIHIMVGKGVVEVFFVTIYSLGEGRYNNNYKINLLKPIHTHT